MDTITTTTLVHWDGSRFHQLDILNEPSGGIAVTSPNDVWLLSRSGLWHYDGVGWNLERAQEFYHFHNLWGVRGAGAFFTTPHGHIFQSP
jgi:hypothetical protein